MNLAFFDHVIVPPMEKTKKAPCSLGASFAFVMGIKLIQIYYLCLLGQVFIPWGTFWIFVGNFKGTLIFNFLGMLTVPDGSFAELSFNSNRSCIKKETSWGLLNAVESL